MSDEPGLPAKSAAQSAGPAVDPGTSAYVANPGMAVQPFPMQGHTSQIAVAIGGPSPDPLLEKYTETHITDVIANTAKAKEREGQLADQKSARQHVQAMTDLIGDKIIAGGVLLLIGLIAYWMTAAGKYEIAEKIVYAFFGVLGGYGLGMKAKSKEKSKED